MGGNAGQLHWIGKLKKKYPKFFKDIKVLEIGSYNVNGSIRSLFDNCDYSGLDVAPGRGVDIVSVAHHYEGGPYDVVCSVNHLEHDMYWKKSLAKMTELVKPKGLLWFVACASWEEHGTERTSPEQSLTSQVGHRWAKYYRNLTDKDIGEVLDLKKFSDYKLEINPYSGIDVCFWGVKK